MQVLEVLLRVIGLREAIYALGLDVTGDHTPLVADNVGKPGRGVRLGGAAVGLTEIGGPGVLPAVVDDVPVVVVVRVVVDVGLVVVVVVVVVDVPVVVVDLGVVAGCCNIIVL